MLFFIFLCTTYLTMANEATLTADTITAEEQTINGIKETIMTAEGNVNMHSSDFSVTTDKLLFNQQTKYTTFPKETQIVYHHNIPITIVAKELKGSPEMQDISGKGIIMKSDIVSYKSQDVQVKRPIATFHKASFSTCKMFDKNNNECNTPWKGRASFLEYNYDTNIIKAKNFRLNVHKIPIFYIPYIKFNLNKKKDGFQQFNIISANGQQGFTIDYIKYYKKYGKFLFRPEIYINQNASSPDLSRGNNLTFIHENETVDKSFSTKTNLKIATSVNKQEVDGLYDGNKSNRYYIRNKNIKTTEHSSFEVNLNVASDRFFRRVYNNLVYENYSTSKISYTNFNHTNRLYKLNSTHYRPMTENNIGAIPSLISSAQYNKVLNDPHKNGYNFISNNEILNFQRFNGTSGIRAITNLNATKLFTFKGYNIETNPNLSLSHYRYTKKIQPQTNASRIRGDINTKISKPFFYKIGSFVAQVKPIIFIDYTTHHTSGMVINEDSFANFIRDDNVFLSSRYNGVDLVDEGLKGAYGLDVYALNKHRHKMTFFLAQRYNTQSNLSNYVGKVGIKLKKIDLTSRFIVSKNTHNILFSNSSIAIQPFSFLNLKLGYFFLDKSLQSNAILDITNTENILYSITLSKNNHQIFAEIIQNPSFIDINNQKKNVIMSISSGIGYKSDCLTYRIGLQRQLSFTGTQNITNNSIILEFKMGV
ncbi:MAG: lipopolysaccharide assembly outer membrane protein LptD (OstA) [Candidatus Deianiraeaceae bacterium]|jgi:lipopolysaccharide assembly outer membrane protein LptD (OstA)